MHGSCSELPPQPGSSEQGNMKAEQPLQRDTAAAFAAAEKPGRAGAPLLGLTASPQQTQTGQPEVCEDERAANRCQDLGSLQAHAAISAVSAGEAAAAASLLNFTRVSNNSTAVMKKISSSHSIQGKNMKISYEYKPRTMLIPAALSTTV